MAALPLAQVPDSRVMRRLAWLVRQQGTPAAFVRAARGLAQAERSHAEGALLPGWAIDVSEVLVGALLRVADTPITAPGPALELALACGTLAVARPEVAPTCAARMGRTLDEVWEPAHQLEPADAAALAVLALWADDAERAAEAAARLRDAPCPGSGAIYDHVVARLQDHGPWREAHCVSHLRVALATEPLDRAPDLLWTAVWALLRLEDRSIRDAAARWAELAAAPTPRTRRSSGTGPT